MENKQKIIECVANISEGRDRDIICSIAEKIKTTPQVYLLGIDSNIDANRTVLTFAGQLDQVKTAVLKMYEEAFKKINMEQHKGVHARNGAVDVCPFIPVYNSTMEECIALAQKIGKEVASKLSIPVYLYGLAATDKKREKLYYLRKGQYEALSHKLNLQEWKPDFGPNTWGPNTQRFGATQIGARPFMIAYNISLDSNDVKIAQKIARLIRSSGYKKTKGLLSFLEADGWFMESYNCAQVTMNLRNYKTTGLHTVYETILELSHKFSTKITGSEIIGLVPLEALLEAGNYYNLKLATDTDTLLKTAIKSLGLNQVRPFEPENQIFEKVLKKISQGLFSPPAPFST